MCRRVVADDIEAVSETVLWAGGLAADAGLSQELCYAVEVCLEEALANLICHGRARNGGKGIAVWLRIEPPRAWLTIADRCVPFDSVDEGLPPMPTAAAPLVGGQGLRLLRAFSTGVSYRSDPDGNELNLEFAPQPQTPAEVQ
jgi:anti-sigma regulatory factor (Ser/Thr protein kinase)